MGPFEQPPLCKKRKETESDVITIDDEEPVPPPSPEVLELRKELARTEVMCQRLLRKAGKAETRAQRAEDLLDSKRDVFDKQAKMEDSVSRYNRELLLENAQQRSELYAAKKSLEAASKANLALIEEKNEWAEQKEKWDREREEWKEKQDKLQAAYEALKSEAELKDWKAKAHQLLLENGEKRSELYAAKNSLETAVKANVEIIRENAVLQLEINRLKDISAQLEEKDKSFAQARVRDRARIYELATQLSKLTKAVKEQQKQQTTPSGSTTSVKPPAATATISPVESPASDGSLPDRPDSPGQALNASTNVHDINDPINLFRLCPAHEPSIAPTEVVTQLRNMFKPGMVSKWKVYCANCNESYACGLCKMVVPKVDVFNHFFMARHTKLMHSRAKNTSPAALLYWKDQLELASGEISDATPGINLSTALAAAGHRLQPTAAAAAASGPTAAAGMDEEVNNDAHSTISVEI